MTKARRVLVIGAGLSGLASAARLLDLAPRTQVEVWESSDRSGGWIGTERVPTTALGLSHDPAAELVVDLGPESILRDKPAAWALVERLGLEDRVVRTRSDRHGAYVVSRGALARIPDGFSLIGPGDLMGFARSDVISLEGKARAAIEMGMTARSRARDEDESLASFVRRRFGWEVLERLAQPLASGIYGADPEVLGMLATVPRFLDMEAAHGSVTRALVAAARKKKNEEGSGARYGLFFSFDGGMQVLTDALAARVASSLRFGRTALALRRARHGGFEVTDGEGSSEHFDAVVIALAAHRVARLIAELDPQTQHALDEIPHGSAATITFAWRRDEVPHALDAYGFVVPHVERRRILASTWSSEKWPGRAPADLALIRVFAGGEDACARRDDALLAIEARRELADLMGITAPPLLQKVVRYARAMPIQGPDHLARRDAIAKRLESIPDLAVAGNSLFGVGIPDSIASGERAAERVSAR